MRTQNQRDRAAPAPVAPFDQPASPVAAQPPGARAPAPASAIVRAGPPDLPAPVDAHGFDPQAYDWVPVPRARRVDGWTPERQRAFIGHLADTGSVRTAADRSGMSTSAAYRLRRSPEGLAFAAAWDAAIQQAAHALVDAAFERAVNGSEEPVFDRDGRVVGRRYRQSDAMMMFLLRKHFPDRYGDNHRDRAAPAVSANVAPPPPVAERLARLGPVAPADPAATLSAGALDLALARADAGKVPPCLQGGAGDPDEGEGGLGPAFEAMLGHAKAAVGRSLRGEDADDAYADEARRAENAWEDAVSKGDEDGAT